MDLHPGDAQTCHSVAVNRAFPNEEFFTTDNSDRRQTSSRLITPARTALTITALRRVTQRFVSGEGANRLRSAGSRFQGNLKMLTCRRNVRERLHKRKILEN